MAYYSTNIGFYQPFTPKVCIFSLFVVIYYIMLKKNLSFHPRLGAGLDLFFGLVFWWSMRGVSNVWALLAWVVVRVLLWVALVWFVSYVPGTKRWQHFASLCLFLVGALSFLIFIEWPFAWNLVGLILAFVPAFSFWLLPSVAGQPIFVFKPYRRWRLMMSTFGLLGLWSGGYAMATLQVFPFITWVFILVATLISTLTAAWWLLEYGCEINRNFWLWVIAVAMFILELSTAVFLWPIGYFVSGFLLAWFWYIIWIMARFHLSTLGINWKKQIYFFAGNGIAILLFLLFIVRWR